MHFDKRSFISFEVFLMKAVSDKLRKNENIKCTRVVQDTLRMFRLFHVFVQTESSEMFSGIIMCFEELRIKHIVI